MSSAGTLTAEWRAEAIIRLNHNCATANLNSGGYVKDCWVPKNAVIPGTSQIDPSKNEYHNVMISTVPYAAHRAMLELILNRHLEEGEEAMHLCNNKACRNPLHLKVGTMKDNMEYAVQCGRIASGLRNGHATCPEQTPRGEKHYNTRLKGKELQTALSLLKKYDGVRGSIGAIAAYIGTTTGTLYNLTRNKRHLNPDVGSTDIELNFKKWVPRAEKQPEQEKADLDKVVREIRQRFHDTPEHARTIMIEVLAKDYDYSPTWIRRIVMRKEYQEFAQDIPLPVNMGVGTRRHPEKKKEDEQK